MDSYTFSNAECMPRAPVPFSDSPKTMSCPMPSSSATTESVAPETSEILSRVSSPSSMAGNFSYRSVATMAPRMESPRNSSRS